MMSFLYSLTCDWLTHTYTHYIHTRSLSLPSYLVSTCLTSFIPLSPSIATMSEAPPLPSATAYAVAAAILAGTLGYFFGQASSIGFFGSSPSQHKKDKRRSSDKKSKESWPNSYDVTIHPDSSDEELMASLRCGTRTGTAAAAAADSDSDADADSSDEEEDEAGGELASFADMAEEHKLVLVVRTDLGMGKGMSYSSTPTT